MRDLLSVESIGDAAFSSAAHRRLVEEVRLLARDAHSTLLIEGESGTGKTFIAREIHRLSVREAAPFRRVDLGTLNDELTGSDLFGHLQGAFTDAKHSRKGAFLSAQGGTVFLDEFGKSSATVQEALLWISEYGELSPVGADRDIRVDVRLILATNVPLAQMLADGRILPDLAARLKYFRLEVPPLRKRREDIPLLVHGYVELHATNYGYETPPDVDIALMTALHAAEWRDNLRELDAAVRRILLNARGGAVLTLDLCEGDLEFLRVASERAPVSDSAVLETVKNAESIVEAAKLVGLHRTTVYKRLRQIEARSQEQVEGGGRRASRRGPRPPRQV